jgi:hypothetical protein
MRRRPVARLDGSSSHGIEVVPSDESIRLRQKPVKNATTGRLLL